MINWPPAKIILASSADADVKQDRMGMVNEERNVSITAARWGEVGGILIVNGSSDRVCLPSRAGGTRMQDKWKANRSSFWLSAAERCEATERNPFGNAFTRGTAT